MASEATDGRVYGDHVLGRRIAVGGMAEVFEARRADGKGPPLVVKVLLPQYARDPEIVEALRHEAEIASTIVHDTIVRVVAFGSEAGETWLAMERVDGGTLAELVAHLRESGGRVPLSAALYVARRLLTALEHVHEAKGATGAPLAIVHRDVTPENILVDREGKVKLGDFGMARSTRRGGRTRTGVIKGKLAYLAPEQATGSALDARTDLYAAGVVLWELVTGGRWLDGENEIELLRAAEEPVFRAPSELVGTPPALDAVLARALRRFPEERFATAYAMREALERVAATVDGDGEVELAALARALFRPGATARAETPAGPAGSVARSPSSAVVAVAVAAIVAIGALAASIAVGGRTRDDRTGSGGRSRRSTGAFPRPTREVEQGRDAALADAGLLIDARFGDAPAGRDAGRTRAPRRDRHPDASRPPVPDAGAGASAREALLAARRDSVLSDMRARGIPSRRPPDAAPDEPRRARPRARRCALGRRGARARDPRARRRAHRDRRRVREAEARPRRSPHRRCETRRRGHARARRPGCGGPAALPRRTPRGDEPPARADRGAVALIRARRRA